MCGNFIGLSCIFSESEVYALTTKGEVFKRVGVTEKNYIGDAWEKIPGKLARISGNLIFFLAQFPLKKKKKGSSFANEVKYMTKFFFRLRLMSICSE